MSSGLCLSAGKEPPPGTVVSDPRQILTALSSASRAPGMLPLAVDHVRGAGDHSLGSGRPSPVQRRDFRSWPPPGRDFLFSSWSSGSALDPGRGGEVSARRSGAPDAHPAFCMIAFSTPAGEGRLQLDGGRGVAGTPRLSGEFAVLSPPGTTFLTPPTLLTFLPSTSHPEGPSPHLSSLPLMWGPGLTSFPSLPNVKFLQ